MDESRPWLPALSSEVLSLDAIRLVFSFLMSKKVPRGDKHRDEIVQMEEGSRTRSHRWDASALEGVPLSTTRKGRRPQRDKRSPTPSKNQRASSGSAPKRHYPHTRARSGSHGPPE